MVFQLVSGVRRSVVLAVAGIIAAISIGIGWYVGYKAWLRIMEAAAGRVVFAVPAFQPVENGSLNPDVVSLRVESFQLHVSGFEPSAQALFIGSTVLSAAAVIFAVAAVVLLCFRLVRDVPFGNGPTWLVAIAGITVVAAGFVVPVLEGEAKRRTVENLPGVSSVNSPIGVGDAAYYITSSIELLPICVGLAALLLAAVFRKGALLNRDIKGLV